jgi:potassium-transporting ATPase KdpC subunit
MRELRTAAIAAITGTVLLGLVYPLVMTGAAQALFPHRADGETRLIGRDSSRDAAAFQSRPSATGHSPTATFFNNQGPNQKALARQLERQVAAYLEREGPFTPGLTAAGIPADAVTTSASGVDPDISYANARIQAHRVAAGRGMTRAAVMRLVDDHVSRPLFGLAGHRSVNVNDLNRALAR